MISDSKKQIAIPFLMAILCLSIGLISFGINNYRISKQLINTQEVLTLTQETLEEYTEKYNSLNEDYAKLSNDINFANDTIESLKGDKYIVDATITENEINMLAKTVWGEARGCSKLEQSAVVWCILNRVDAGSGTIAEVITAEGQFSGYSKNFPVEDNIKDLVQDVVARWKIEKTTCGNIGRTLPKEYLYFSGRGGKNYFRDAYKGDYNVWDWNCWNPYE